MSCNYISETMFFYLVVGMLALMCVLIFQRVVIQSQKRLISGLLDGLSITERCGNDQAP